MMHPSQQRFETEPREEYRDDEEAVEQLQRRTTTSDCISSSRGSVVYGKSVRKRTSQQDPPPSSDRIRPQYRANEQYAMAVAVASHATHLEPPAVAVASLPGSQLPTPNNQRNFGNSNDDDEAEEWSDTRRCAPEIFRRTSSKRNITDGLHHLQIEHPAHDPVDPWERDISPLADVVLLSPQTDPMLTPAEDSHRVDDELSDDEDDSHQSLSPNRYERGRRTPSSGRRSTFLGPSDIHPNMLGHEDDVAKLRLLAGQLSADWRGQDFMAPALARRIRDFQFAQEKRRKTYGDERPWGILGLYDHLAGIRIDVEWAEDAARRRANGEPYRSWADFDACKKKGVDRTFFTYFVLVACTIVLIASIALNGWTVEPLNVNPMIGPSAQTLIRMGAKASYLIVKENQAWRLVTSAFLHAGLVHFVINMLALWFVGTAIETSHGVVAATIAFVIPAVGGTILSAIFLPQYITVGASGGIFGLIGACLADIIVNWKLLFSHFVTENGKRHHHAMVIVALFFDILLNCVIGLTPYVDNFTHIGGMVFGFLCGLSTMERLSVDFFGMEQDCVARAKQIFVRFLGLIISVIGIIVSAIILFQGDGTTSPCPECSRLSCVSFPPWGSATNKWWYCDDCTSVTAQLVTSPVMSLELNCPDKTIISVALGNNTMIDQSALVRKLPSYCRQYCPNKNKKL